MNSNAMTYKQTNHSWGWFMGVGIIFIILGIFAITMPLAAATALEQVLGWIFLIGGIISGAHALRARGTSVFIIKLLGSIVYLAAGILLLFYPLQGVLTLTLLLAIFLFISGIFKIILAMQFKGTSNWGWMFLSGLIALLLSGLIWSQWPYSAAWVIGLLVGIDFLFGGFSLTMLSVAIRKK
jgi:uncharacterized membrane protein HdeD (DUF308 family)